MSLGLNTPESLAATLASRGGVGAWWSPVPLILPTVLEAGTHISERAAHFDDSPTEGWILAGHPEAVERARTTRIFDEIMAMPVVREP